MILIASGAYVVSEFQVELGRIPPCFLPLGNKKLLEHQVATLSQRFPNEILLVSLPMSYQLSSDEKDLIKKLGIDFILIPEDFSLSESIAYAINISNYNIDDNVIRIMYGDTLVEDLPTDDTNLDILGVAYSHDSYNWKIEDDSQDPLIWCGFYSFSSKLLLLRMLALNRHDFILAVEDYRNEKVMTLHKFKHWFDLGHINTYFRSRALITTQRAFNELKISEGVVHKTGLPSIKIQAEGLWFKNIPRHLKIYAPQLIDSYIDDQSMAHYMLEYLPHMPLNELFVHGQNTPTEWNSLFGLIRGFLQKAGVPLDDVVKNNNQIDFLNLVREKTFNRLNQYVLDQQISIHSKTLYANTLLPSLHDICLQCIDAVVELEQINGILHGDLCFSNILYDSRAFQVKVIDPRGLNFQNEFTIYGDQKYDLAKLTHSVIGLYDHIIAGRYVLHENRDSGSLELIFDVDDRINEIQNIFSKFEFFQGLNIEKIMPLVILLFLSMLPLHSDRPDRQKAMLANALRLFKQFMN